MAKNLPGFFFDPEKGKYFPNHLKPAYDKEQKIKKSKEAEFSRTHPSLPTSLSKFLSVGSANRLFDSIPERLNRIEIKEFPWQNLIDIHADDGLCFRLNRIDGITVCETVCLEKNIVLATFEPRWKFKAPIVDFKVMRSLKQDKLLYCFVTGDLQDNSGNHITVFTSVFGIVIADMDFKTSQYCLERHPRPYFCTVTDYLTAFYVQRLDGKDTSDVINKQLNDVVAMKWVFRLGMIYSSRGGLLEIVNNYESPNVSFTLECNSTANWIDYYAESGKIILTTFHGHVISVDLKSKQQTLLFEINDLPFSAAGKFRFEDFQVKLVGKLLMMGYRGGTEIIGANVLEGRVLKKIQLPSPFEQFEFTSDYSSLYIQVK